MQKRLTINKKWRILLMCWHRRFGVAVSLLVLWLSVTGILLNHSDQLQLNRQSVGQSLLKSLYGIEPPTLTSFRVGDHWLSHLGANHLYMDEKEIAYCVTPFNGALWFNNQYIVSCGDGLLLLTQKGEVLERIGSKYGVPLPIVALAVVDNQLLLKTSQAIIKANLEQLQWQPYDNEIDIAWVSPSPVAEPLAAQLLSQNEGTLTWERVVLDLHNGRLVGRLGVYLLDASALLLMVLAISGVWIWATRRPN